MRGSVVVGEKVGWVGWVFLLAMILSKQGFCLLFDEGWRRCMGLEGSRPTLFYDGFCGNRAIMGS